MSNDFPGPSGGAPVPGAPGAPYQAAPQRSGIALAGLILAFLFAPVGLILSIAGLVHASKPGRTGKGLAVAGLIISLVAILSVSAGIYLIVDKVGDKIETLADPGCTTGKDAILDNAATITNPDTMKEGLQATIDGLADAEAKAKDSEVKAAMKAAGDDYRALLKSVEEGTAPDPALETKLTTDANKIDELCTLGGAQE